MNVEAFKELIDIYSDFTIELHSKFPYLDYYDEPLWVDMFDPEVSKVVSK